MTDLRRWILLVEGLARPEVLDYNDYQVVINPTPIMLRRMLKKDRYHEIRIITLGQDIAIASSWGIIHVDMATAITKHAHPAWGQQHPQWYLGEGCWFLSQRPDGMLVSDKKGRIVPLAEWPLALQKAVGNDVSSDVPR